jgi:hypothetical protein
MPVSEVAFRPTDEDFDGISLFREMFLSPRDLSAIGRKPPYAVTRIRASDVIDIGVSLDVTPDPKQPPGHVSVPELNTASRKEDRKRLLPYQVALAHRCSIAYDPHRQRRFKLHGDSTGSLVLAMA